jgi:tetraacyldisaccharide 4'-kinase
MKNGLARWLTDIWYKDHFTGVWLLPLSLIFSHIVRFRKFLYTKGILKSHTIPVPIIVVGNITVGGTGKTPLIIYLAEILKNSGFNPGIISRGYGGLAQSWPQRVYNDSDPNQIGDEVLLIAKQTNCPMAVGPSRVNAANMLVEQTDCNIILSDDGLQHYALRRDIEIAVIDGDRRFGNNYMLPAGPLREPIERLQHVNFTIVNGEKHADHEYSMQLVGDTLVNLISGEQKSLEAFNGIDCHAIAGIGNPKRFFNLLKIAGLNCINHSFPDHYQFQQDDIEYADDKPVLMTEKDAVKCTTFAGLQHWFLPVKAIPESHFSDKLLKLLKRTS